MLVGMWTVKIVLIGFNIGMKTLFEIGIEIMHVILWKKYCLYFFPCPKTFYEAEFKCEN